MANSDCSYLPRKFETHAYAKERRKKLIRMLKGHGSRKAKRLAKKLRKCRKKARCDSGACPVCQRIWRRRFLKEAIKIVCVEGSLLRVSIIPKGGRLSPGELLDFDLDQHIKSRRRALQRSLPSNIAVIGGVDVSYNTMNNEDPHWQVHGYWLLLTNDSAELREKIRKGCPPEPTAVRPYCFKPVEPEHYAEVLSYAVKASFNWRSSYTDKNGMANSRNNKLPKERTIEAALFLDRFPISSRLVLKRIRRFYAKHGLKLTVATSIQSPRSLSREA